MVWCGVCMRVVCVCACLHFLTTDGPAALRLGAAMVFCWRGRSPGATKYISTMNCSTSLEYTLARQEEGEGGKGGRGERGGDGQQQICADASLHMDTWRCCCEILALPAPPVQDGEEGPHFLPRHSTAAVEEGYP